jgi:hypothetical protein
MHGAERVVVELLRRQVDGDPALRLDLDEIHPEHLDDWRGRHLAAADRVQHRHATAPAQVRGVDRRVAPGEGTGAAVGLRQFHGRSLTTSAESVNQIQL